MAPQRRITGAQLQTARKLLGWTAEEMADRCEMSVGGIRRLLSFPKGPLRARPETAARIVRRLDAAGIEFTDDEPGVKLRKAKG